MKRLLLPALLLAALSTDAQTKKVLLEDFTGIWCGHCPNGSKGIDDMEAQYPANFLAVAVHNDNSASLAGPKDVLEIAEGEYLATSAGLGSKGFPSGAVDRKLWWPSNLIPNNPPSQPLDTSTVRLGINGAAQQWKMAVDTQTQKTAIVSISFANFHINANGDYVTDVKVKFTSAPQAGIPLVLQVYVIEDSIKAEVFGSDNLKQVSYNSHYGSSGTTSAPVYITTTANKFYHNNTLRAAIGGNWGFPIPTPTVGQEWTKNVQITFPASAIPAPWVKKNVHFYAFVAQNGTYKSHKQVLNAESISAMAFNKVGISDVTALSILNAHPNPAKSSDVINIEYNIANSEVVTMKVYNLVGQQVAQPYSSNEVKGAHTILWRPSESNVTTPGIYLVEISSPSGKQVQRINIR